MTRTTTLKTTLALAATTLFGLGACGVNELATYRGSIESIEVQTLAPAEIELEISDPAVVSAPGEETPADAATAATESYIITKLSERLRRYIAPEQTASAFDAVFASDLARGSGWSLAPRGQAPDAKVVVAIDGYGVSVDALGHAQVHFRMTLSAWFEAEGKLIYKSWRSHEAPLFPASYALGPPVIYGDAAAAAAAERAYNLMVLSDIGGPELQGMILSAARDAASDAAREMVRDTWR